MIKKEDMDYQEIINHSDKIRSLVIQALNDGGTPTETAVMKYCESYDLDWGEWEQLRIDTVALYFRELPW